MQNRWNLVKLATLKNMLIVVGMVLVVGLIMINNSAVAKEPLGRTWPAAQQISMSQVNHSTYDALLKKYVDGDGYVNYKTWHATPADRQALQQYLLHLSQASPTAQVSRDEQLAFWINAYNAVTLEGILQVYPTDSIRKHTAKIGGYNIWDDLPLLVGGRPYSLNDIEHKVLRKMGEPRIHFAIVCASVGCPRLLNEAYTSATLEAQLALNSTDFFSRQQNFMVDQSGTMHLSSILDWFGEDFGANQAQKFTYLQPYIPEQARQFVISPQAKVKYQEYSWSLNDQSMKTEASGKRGASSKR